MQASTIGAGAEITQLRRPSSVAVISLPSRFDVHATQAFNAEIRDACDAGADTIRIDATLVKHADVAGLRTLADASALSAARHISIEIFPSSTLQIAWDLTGTHHGVGQDNMQVAA